MKIQQGPHPLPYVPPIPISIYSLCQLAFKCRRHVHLNLFCVHVTFLSLWIHKISTAPTLSAICPSYTHFYWFPASTFLQMKHIHLNLFCVWVAWSNGTNTVSHIPLLPPSLLLSYMNNGNLSKKHLISELALYHWATCLMETLPSVSSIVVQTVGDNLEHCFQGVVCTTKYGKCGYAEWKNSNKMAKNEKKIGGKWGMVGDHVEYCVQGPAQISKYGKCGYAKGEISIKWQKNERKIRMVGDNVGHWFQGPMCISKYGKCSLWQFHLPAKKSFTLPTYSLALHKHCTLPKYILPHAQI